MCVYGGLFFGDQEAGKAKEGGGSEERRKRGRERRVRRRVREGNRMKGCR